jgi:hypothetical protein
LQSEFRDTVHSSPDDETLVTKVRGEVNEFKWLPALPGMGEVRITTLHPWISHQCAGGIFFARNNELTIK